MHVNLAALLAVLAFAGLMLAIFGGLYAGAVRSYRRGSWISRESGSFAGPCSVSSRSTCC